MPSKNYDYNDKAIRRRNKDYKKSLEFYEVLFLTEPNEIFWEDTVSLTINSKNGFQHVNLFKFVCLSIYAQTNGGLGYKNTIRRNKDKEYDLDEVDQANERNKIRVNYAMGNPEFVRLSNHLIAEFDESIDESAEREEAERLAQSEDSVDQSEHDNFEENQDGNGFMTDRMKGAAEVKGGKNTAEREFENNEKKRENKKDANVIYDPVLTNGGFKILPQYHDTLIFESEDLIDQIEDGLYKDYIHKGSKKFKEIFDVAILSRADVDIALMPSLTKAKKEKMGLESSLVELKEEDINFEFDLAEKFKPNSNNSGSEESMDSAEGSEDESGEGDMSDQESDEDEDQDENDSDDDGSEDSS